MPVARKCWLIRNQICLGSETQIQLKIWFWREKIPVPVPQPEVSSKHKLKKRNGKPSVLVHVCCHVRLATFTNSKDSEKSVFLFTKEYNVIVE